MNPLRSVLALTGGIAAGKLIRLGEDFGYVSGAILILYVLSEILRDKAERKEPRS